MREYWIALSRLLLPPRTTSALLNSFGTPQKIFSASEKQLQEVGCSTSTIKKIKSARIHEAEKEAERLKEEGIKLLSIDDECYPPLLAKTYTPPPLLYVKGDETLLMEKTIAIVGSRDASGWAKEFAHTLSFKLALSGVVIVSGLARGIDSAAHLGALEGGRTVAVLGNGMDYYYPVSNKALYERIEREGALVTEFPMGTKPYKRNFPQRNRIISGLSEAVVVVQAPLRSGALITASCALEQGRDVFCVPARPNDRRSEGTNLLIKEGATPITSAEELLQHLGWDHEEGKHIRLPEDEAIIYNTLSSDAMSAEQLLASTKLDAKRVNVALTRLQLQGLIRKRGQFYKRV